MKFLDQLGDAVKDVKELAKSKASVVKDLTAETTEGKEKAEVSSEAVATESGEKTE